MELELQANAKINLALDVLGEREDGYHEIDTIMQEISLHDNINMENGRGGFVLFCDHPMLKLDESNLIYKAWDLMRPLAEDDSVIIELEKNIPLAAGLGGGSSDAAATMRGLNFLWGLNLSDDELEEMAKKIDSDTAFFIKGGTQRGRGRGNELESLPNFYGHNILLLNPGETISSRYVYEHVKKNGKIAISEIADMMSNDNPKVFSMFENQLESVSMSLMPQLETMKIDLKNTGAMCYLMSGSGPTMFGIYEDSSQAEKAEEALRGKYSMVTLVKSL